MSTRWLLVRHGRTERNQQRILSGQDDVELDYEGRWQAVRLGLTLRAESPPPLLLCSDLRRARQSASAIAQAAGWPPLSGGAWTVHPALRERSLGQWQGASYDALRSRGDTERLIRWSRRPPGGESLRGLARRVLGYLTQLPNEPGLLVAHAGPIRVLWGLAHGLRREEIGVLRIPQEHALELDLPPGGWAALARRITPR